MTRAAIGLAVLLLTSIAAADCLVPQWEPHLSPTNVSLPSTMVSADLDGDGIMDVLARGA